MTSRSAFLAALFPLAGCGSLVTGTVLEMNRLDPFTADPAGFAVGVETGAGLGLSENSVHWTLTATHSPSGEVWELDMTLAEDRSRDGLVIYRPTPVDVGRLRAWQEELAPWRETSDGNSSLNMTVSANGCRIPGSVLPEDPRVTVLVQLAPDAAMRPLLQNAPILEFFDIADLAALPDCIGPA